MNILFDLLLLARMHWTVGKLHAFSLSLLLLGSLGRVLGTGTGYSWVLLCVLVWSCLVLSAQGYCRDSKVLKGLQSIGRTASHGIVRLATVWQYQAWLPGMASVAPLAGGGWPQLRTLGWGGVMARSSVPTSSCRGGWSLCFGILTSALSLRQARSALGLSLSGMCI